MARTNAPATGGKAKPGKPGKPTTYTQELADFVVNGLWQGKTIRALEAENSKIRRQTIGDWRQKHPDFDARYRAAMEGGAHAIVEETREIVDNITEDAQSRRIRAWQRMEEATRKAPHLFGAKVAVKHSGAIGTYDLSGLSDDELASLESILARVALAGGDSGGEGAPGA